MTHETRFMLTLFLGAALNATAAAQTARNCADLPAIHVKKEKGVAYGNDLICERQRNFDPSLRRMVYLVFASVTTTDAATSRGNVSGDGAILFRASSRK
jgi:hypothetical protein